MRNINYLIKNMKSIKLTLIALFVGFISTSFAQSIKVIEGTLAPLKGSGTLNVEYDWSEFRVGKFATEKEYLTKKTTEYNEKEAGKGDKWAESWKADKAGRFQPEFENLFNKYSTKFNLNLGNEVQGKYKAIVKTTFLEPGFNVYVTKKPASADMVIDIVETANPSKVIAKIVIKGSLGRTYGFNDFDTGVRISECYALAGKKLAAFMAKQLK